MLGQPTPGGGQVDTDDTGHAAIGQTGNGRQTDWAATEYRHQLTRMDVGLLRRVHPHRDRLGQGGDIERHTVGNRMQATAAGRLADQNRLGQPALRGPVADPAQLVVARMDHHPVPHRRTHHLGAELPDHPGELVAQRHRLAVGSGQSAHRDVAQVAAADAAGVHIDDRIARPAHRCRHPVY